MKYTNIQTVEDLALYVLHKHYSKHVTLEEILQKHVDKIFGENVIMIPKIDLNIKLKNNVYTVVWQAGYPKEQPIVRLVIVPIREGIIFKVLLNHSSMGVYYVSIEPDDIYDHAINDVLLKDVKDKLLGYKIKQTAGGLHDIFEL